MRCVVWLLVLLLPLGVVWAAAPSLVVVPDQVVLEGNFARAQLVVRQPVNGEVNERSDDVTSQAIYRSSDPSIVAASSAGQLLAVGNGEATIAVDVNGDVREIPVKVTGVLDQPQAGFTESIRPILNKAGCAMAA